MSIYRNGNTSEEISIYPTIILGLKKTWTTQIPMTMFRSLSIFCLELWDAAVAMDNLQQVWHRAEIDHPNLLQPWAPTKILEAPRRHHFLEGLLFRFFTQISSYPKNIGTKKHRFVERWVTCALMISFPRVPWLEGCRRQAWKL